MPSAPAHQCRGRNKFGCARLVRPPQKYCDGCNGRLSQHEAAQRGSSSDRGYTPEWQKYSAKFRYRFRYCGDRPEDALIRNVSAAWTAYREGCRVLQLSPAVAHDAAPAASLCAASPAQALAVDSHRPPATVHRPLSMEEFVHALGHKLRDGYLFPRDPALDPFSLCRRSGLLTLVTVRTPGEVAAHAAIRGVLDHIQPVRGPSDMLFHREDNHQSLCVACHAFKTGLEKSSNTGL